MAKGLYRVVVQEVNEAGAIISPPTRWVTPADEPLGALRELLREAEPEQVERTVTESNLLPSTSEQIRQLGQDLLEIAALCDMPLSYFRQEARLGRAAAAMGFSRQQAYDWSRRL